MDDFAWSSSAGSAPEEIKPVRDRSGDKSRSKSLSVEGGGDVQVQATTHAPCTDYVPSPCTCTAPTCCFQASAPW